MGVIHDFDPSGEEHSDDCICPCCEVDGEVYCELHFRWYDVDEECEECERDRISRA